MKKHTEPLLPDTYYHVYNRGINGCRIFIKSGNTAFFLQKYAEYIEPIAETFAYALMGNHFHFLIKTRSEAEIRAYYSTKKTKRDLINEAANPAYVNKSRADKSATYIISAQFGTLFNSYAQAINKQNGRTGGLLEEPFRRIPVYTDNYAAHLVYYIHNNPVKHGFTKDLTEYPFSSYSVFLDDEPTFIQRDKVFEWFGSKQAFFDYHGTKHPDNPDWYDENWVEI